MIKAKTKAAGSTGIRLSYSLSRIYLLRCLFFLHEVADEDDEDGDDDEAEEIVDESEL